MLIIFLAKDNTPTPEWEVLDLSQHLSLESMTVDIRFSAGGNHDPLRWVADVLETTSPAAPFRKLTINLYIKFRAGGRFRPALWSRVDGLMAIPTSSVPREFVLNVYFPMGWPMETTYNDLRKKVIEFMPNLHSRNLLKTGCESCFISTLYFVALIVLQVLSCPQLIFLRSTTGHLAWMMECTSGTHHILVCCYKFMSNIQQRLTTTMDLLIVGWNAPLHYDTAGSFDVSRPDSNNVTIEYHWKRSFHELDAIRHHRVPKCVGNCLSTLRHRLIACSRGLPL